MVRVACFLLAALAAGCSGGSNEPRALIWARGDDSSTLDPAEIESGEDAKITWSLYETLLTYKGDTTELEGRLAESWSFSPDGRTLSLELRKGVRFHDGTPFDSESVVFTLGRLMDPRHPFRPKTPPPYAANFAVIDRVAADGPHRVVLTLKSPSVVILQNLALFGAAIVSPSAVKKFGDAFPRNPVGSGPYRLQRWDRDVRIVLDPFPGYWGPKPAIDRVIVVPVKSPQTAIEKLKKGEVHVVDHPTLADAKTLQSDPATRLEVQSPLTVCYLAFNLKKHPYSDLQFRRAVSLALDRKTLNELAYYGQAEPAANLVPPVLWKGICPTPDYEFSLEKAKEALAKVKPEPGPIELIHMTFSRPYIPEPLRVAEFVKDQLRKIGLEVKLTGYDRAAYTLRYKEEGHPMYLYGWMADIADPDNFYYPLLHGDSKGDMNGSFFDDREFNEAVTGAQSELDPARRRELYARAYARYREELPTLPLVHVKQLLGLSRNVQYNMHPIEYRFYTASWAK